jgi:hypothetical protein
VKKRYVAWTSDGALLSISPAGALLSSQGLRARLTGFGAIYDGANAQTPRLTLAPRGDDIALVYIDEGEVSHIWSHNERSGQVMLTYKRPATQTR